MQLNFLFLLLAPGATAMVQGGAVDFSSMPWEEAHALSGEWRFFPREFLTEERLRSADFRLEQGLLVKVPAGIDAYVDASGKRLDAQTWGTFVLEFKNLRPPFQNLGLNVRGDTAYRVFALDMERSEPMEMLLNVGKVGTSPDESIPQVASPVGLWRADGSGHYYLVIHLSGFHYPWGGLWTSPQLGSYDLISRRQRILFLSEALAVGAIFAMMIYHFGLFLHRNEDKASLVLSVFSGSILLRMLGSSPTIMNVLFPEPSLFIFEVVRKFEYGIPGNPLRLRSPLCHGDIPSAQASRSFAVRSLDRGRGFNLLPGNPCDFLSQVSDAPECHAACADLHLSWDCGLGAFEQSQRQRLPC
jgi:hypothetical protein